MVRNTWSLSWSQEECIDLILAYQNQEELWNPQHVNYYSKVSKQCSWQAIATDMDCPVDEVKNKINSLLASFRRERRKTRNGQDPNGIQTYNSRWFAYTYLHFVPESEQQQKETGDGHRAEVKSEIIIDENDLMGGASGVSDTESSIDVKVRNSKRKRQRSEDPRIDEAFSILKKAAMTTATDECSSFGRYLTHKLRSYPDHLRNTVIYKINCVMFDADMGRLDDQSN